MEIQIRLKYHLFILKIKVFETCFKAVVIQRRHITDVLGRLLTIRQYSPF